MKRTAVFTAIASAVIAGAIYWLVRSEAQRETGPAAPGEVTTEGLSNVDVRDTLNLPIVREIAADFGGLISLAVDSAGSIYAADFVNSEIRVFGSGEADARIGRDGEGPGEFRGLRSIVVRRDSLFAFDPRLRRITAYDVSGGIPRLQYTLALPLMDPTRPNYQLLAPEAGGFLVPYTQPTRPTYADTAHRRLVVRWIRGDGSVRQDSVVVLRDRVWLITTDERYGVGVSPMPFAGIPVLELGRAGNLYYGATASPLLRRINLKDRTAPDDIRAPRKGLPLTDRDIRALEQSYFEYVGEQAAELVFGRIETAYEEGRLPEHKPWYERLVIDDRGRLWFELITRETALASTPLGLVYRGDRLSGREPLRTHWLILNPRAGTAKLAGAQGDLDLHATRDGRGYAVAVDSLGVHSVVVLDSN